MTDLNLKETQQGFSPGRMVVLFELDLTSRGGPLLRFTSSAFESSAIVFDGNTYTPINCEATGFDADSDGALPSPELKVSNVEFTYQALLYGFDDLLGAPFRRIRTFRQFLDDGADPDPQARFPDDVFVVNRKTEQNKIQISWELRSVLDNENSFLPGRQILKTSCSHIYRTWTGAAFDYASATCPYAGASYFNTSDVPETLPENDRCGKRLASCRARFGENAELPFAGFPGVSKLSR